MSPTGGLNNYQSSADDQAVAFQSHYKKDPDPPQSQLQKQTFQLMNAKRAASVMKAFSEL